MGAQERHWWQKSLRYKLISGVLLMAVPLVSMLIYYNFYAIHTVRGQVAESYQNMLSLYMGQIDSSLNAVDSYMHTVAGAGTDLASLGWAKNDTEYYSSKIYLYNKLIKDIALYDPINSFFVYVGQRNEFMNIPGFEYFSYEESEKIEKSIIDLIQNRPNSKGVLTRKWTYMIVGQEYYIIDMIQNGDIVLGAWVKADYLLEPLKALQIGDEGSVLLAGDHGEPITNASQVINNDIKLLKNSNEYYLSGVERKFLIISTPSIRGNFSLVLMIPDDRILANLPYLRNLGWFIMVGALLFIPAGLYLLRKAVLVPLYRMLRTMKLVRTGKWDSRVVLNDSTDEFRILGESFNSMMEEIEALRINVYEEQINKQKEELQRLQLQINPHFFLNTLNIVYNLAKVKNYELIQEMTMSLIHYFRFMFRSNTSFVKLNEELDHTRNYLRIQTLRFPGQLVWSLEAPDFLLNSPIPPLVIQSFVENSIKHAVTMDHPIQIHVWIDLLDVETESLMKISIRDTGSGFKEQVIKELQSGKSMENRCGEHTGIWNVQRRLSLLYSENVNIRYYNDHETGGAVVDIILPLNPVMEETQQ